MTRSHLPIPGTVRFLAPPWSDLLAPLASKGLGWLALVFPFRVRVLTRVMHQRVGEARRVHALPDTAGGDADLRARQGVVFASRCPRSAPNPTILERRSRRPREGMLEYQRACALWHSRLSIP